MSIANLIVVWFGVSGPIALLIAPLLRNRFRHTRDTPPRAPRPDSDLLDSRPQGDYDSAEARARRVAALTAERDALERQADAGRDRREARDAQRRHWLDLERLRYALRRRPPHVDDMVA